MQTKINPLQKSSSLIILKKYKQSYQTLLLQRKSTMSFNNVYVFPGGLCEETDILKQQKQIHSNQNFVFEEYSKITALRQFLEETGLFVYPSQRVRQIGQQLGGIQDFSRLLGRVWNGKLGLIQPVLRLLTPQIQKGKRFDCIFHICILSPQINILNTSNPSKTNIIALQPSQIKFNKQQSDNILIQSPDKILREWKQDKIQLAPPQIIILNCLQNMISVHRHKQLEIIWPIKIEPIMFRYDVNAKKMILFGDEEYREQEILEKEPQSKSKKIVQKKVEKELEEFNYLNSQSFFQVTGRNKLLSQSIFLTMKILNLSFLSFDIEAFKPQLHLLNKVVSLIISSSISHQIQHIYQSQNIQIRYKQIDFLLLIIFEMDDLVLDIFSNARKSRHTKKQFDDPTVSNSKKRVEDSSKRIQSSISITKNIQQPKNSDAFNYLMKGILDNAKRIDDKYSSNKILTQSQKKNRSKPGSEKDKWKAVFDKIKQEKNQDDHQTPRKEDIGVGTSQTCIGSNQPVNKFYFTPTMPYRMMPQYEGSRIIYEPNQSRILINPPHIQPPFQIHQLPPSHFHPTQQIMQMRPCSMPKPVSNIHPCHEVPLVRSRIVLGQLHSPASPSRITSAQPIIRRQRQQPQIRVINPNGHLLPNIMDSSRVRVFQPQQNLQHIPPHVLMNRQPQFRGFQPRNNLQQYPVNHQYFQAPMSRGNNPQIIQNRKQIEHAESSCQKKPENIDNNFEPIEVNINCPPSISSSIPIPPPERPASMSEQEYKKMLYDYSMQQNELMKQLKQLQNDKNKQQSDMAILQKMMSSNMDSSSQKSKTKVKNVTRITQKHVINQENITNTQNIKNIQQIRNEFNSLNMCNIENIQNMENIQTMLSLQNVQQFKNVENAQVLQFLQRQYIANPQQFLTNPMFLKQLESCLTVEGLKDNRQPLRSISNVESVPKSEKKIESTKLLSQKDVRKIGVVEEQRLVQEIYKKKLFGEELQNEKDKLNQYQQETKINSYFTDLTELKQNNARQSQEYLNKMDQLLQKYNKKPTIFIDPLTPPPQPQPESLSDTIINRLSTFTNIFSKPTLKTQPLPNNLSSQVNFYPSTHSEVVESKEESKEENENENEKGFFDIMGEIWGH